jgi:hypothetical protein
MVKRKGEKKRYRFIMNTSTYLSRGVQRIRYTLKIYFNSRTPQSASCRCGFFFRPNKCGSNIIRFRVGHERRGIGDNLRCREKANRTNDGEKSLSQKRSDRYWSEHEDFNRF